MAKGIKTTPALTINMGGAADFEKRKITEADFRKLAETKRVRVIGTLNAGVYEQVDASKVSELPYNPDGAEDAESVVFMRTGNTYNNLDEGGLFRAVYLYVFAQYTANEDEERELDGYYAMINPYEL
jgi:hypothetical protein